jgi:SAM-dependent methyltransferase
MSTYNSFMDLFLPICALILASLGLLWFFIPILSGIPWVPTKEPRMFKALELAALKPGEIFYDLGCGDGRVLIAAARHYGAKVIGIEISPLHCLVAWIRTRLAGVGKLSTIRWGNFYRADLRDADVVYQYGHSHFAMRLKQQLERQLRDGARVVSIMVDIPGWQPQAFDQDNLIFLYQMPPKPGDVASFMLQESERKDKVVPAP